MHRYTVELRIVGKDLDPEGVTRALGIAPSRVRRHGEPRVEGSRSTWSGNMWALDILPPGRDDWSSLEDALGALLNIFGPIRNQIQAYIPTNQTYIWCGHFTSSFDGGPTLSPALLKSLGDLGIQLFLDTYCETPK